jgi:hypothetical protein
VTPRKGTVPVPGDDRPPQVRRDLVGSSPRVQGEADRGELTAEQAGAQEGGQPGRAGQHVGGIPQQCVVQPGPRRRAQRGRGAAAPGADAGGRAALRAGADQERGRQLRQRSRVEMAGDDRDEGRIAGIGGGGRAGQPARLSAGGRPRGLGGRRARAARAARRARGPFRFRVGRTGHAAQLVQGQVQLDLRRLPGVLRQAPGADQPPAGFFEGVVAPLCGAAHILGAGLLA